MAEHRAADGTVEISADGITYTAIGNVISQRVTPSAASVAVNNMDSIHAQNRHSKNDTSWTFDYHRDNSDSGQGLIETAQSGQGSDTYYYMRFREGVGTGFRQWFGQVVIESREFSGQDGEYVRYTCSGKFYTAPTESDQ